MRDGLAAAAPCCAGCGKPLRPGAQFCPSCGCTAAGSAEKAAPSPPLIERRRPASVFDSHWREIKQVGWLFALLLGSSLIAGVFGRFKTSPWLDVSVSAVDAFIVMAFAVIHYRDIRPCAVRPCAVRRIALHIVEVERAYFIGRRMKYAKSPVKEDRSVQGAARPNGGRGCRRSARVLRVERCADGA